MTRLIPGDEIVTILEVPFSADGKYVSYIHGVGSFKLIDSVTRQTYPVRSGDFGSTIAFSPGGVFVATPTRDSILLFALEDVVGGKK